MSSAPIAVRFGDGTDDDTFIGVFGHLANGYVIAVNGDPDMVCTDLYRDGLVGLFGYRYDPDRDHDDDFYEDYDPDSPVGYLWGDIAFVTIY